jgi:transposase
MGKTSPRYTEEFKRSVVSLYSNGKTQAQLCEEYGISSSALSRWIKAYSEVKVDDGTVMTARQVKELQKRNALLEEENVILKKALAIFTPHSNKG